MDKPLQRLTPREVQVVHCLARGCTYAQIAARLGVSAHTVTSHIKNLYFKLDVHSAAAAVMRAIEHGFIGAQPRSLEHGMRTHAAIACHESREGT
jgi:DNA-binding CsgD family transcriptional regulator